MRNLVLAVLLLSLPASAGYQSSDLPPSGASLFKGAGRQANEFTKNARDIWLDARRSARASLETTLNNPAIRKAVGEDIDARGRMCYLWTKADKKVRAAASVIVQACMAANQATPLWVSIMVNNSADIVKENCNNRDDGKGGTRPKNLGLRYLEEEERAQRDASYRRQFDAMAREDWDTLVEVLRGMSGARVQGIPAPEFFRDLDRLAPAH